MALPRIIAGSCAVLACAPALAEVADKVASVPDLWVTNIIASLVLGFCGFVVAPSFRGAVLVLGLSLLYVWPPAIPSDLLVDIEKELGGEYLLHAFFSQLMVPICAGVGLLVGGKRKHANAT